jgi:hypothetical protein
MEIIVLYTLGKLWQHGHCVFGWCYRSVLGGRESATSA